MLDPRFPLSQKNLNIKPRKKKKPTKRTSLFQLQGNNVKEEVQGRLPLKSVKKSSKRNLKSEIPHPFQQPEGSNSDSLPHSSGTGNEYRALMRKYLLLEDESSALGRELRQIEDEVKTLENEKLALLDQLVVLEGLVGPSEMHS